MNRSGSMQSDSTSDIGASLPVQIAPTCVTIRDWDTTRIQRAEFDTEEGPSDEGRDFEQEALERRQLKVAQRAEQRNVGFAAFAGPSKRGGAGSRKHNDPRRKKRKRKRGRWQEADPFGGTCPEFSRVAHQSGRTGARPPSGGALQLERQLSAVWFRKVMEIHRAELDDAGSAGDDAADDGNKSFGS